MEANKTTAILSPKYKIGNSRQWFADVRCGDCSHECVLPLNGWSAVVCAACGAEMHKQKKKRGRPLGSGGTPRRVRGVRFSDEEWAVVGELAAKAGLDRSAYLRSLL